VWTALLVAHRRLTTQLDGELRAGAEMTLDEYDVLYQVRRARRPLRMSELASQVLVSRPTATRVADHLVRRGWLERGHDTADRRAVLVALTPAGRRAQARAGRLHLDGIARLVEAPLTGHDVGPLVAALRALGGQRALSAR
jgi:DNA-binding MarR family transcriptional regulator